MTFPTQGTSSQCPNPKDSALFSCHVCKRHERKHIQTPKIPLPKPVPLALEASVLTTQIPHRYPSFHRKIRKKQLFLVIVMKNYQSHGQLFPTSVPIIDKDASLLDLASSGNVYFPVNSLETMERQARNMVTINSYADLFTAASVKTLESDNLDVPMLKRLLSSIVSCLKHSSSMAVILAVELLQARREAAIERSEILTEAMKNKQFSPNLF